MKELENMAIGDLIKVYNKYISEGHSKELSKIVREVYNEFNVGGTMLSDVINKAVDALFPLAYPDSGSGLKAPTKDEAKEMIEKLKKVEKELKNS
jgi:HEPN domain-containing protein